MTLCRSLTLAVCTILCFGLLAACGKQAAEAPSSSQPTTNVTQPQSDADGALDEGELPAVTVPQPDELLTGSAEGSEPEGEIDSAETTQPIETKPAQEPQSSDSPQTSEPTQSTEAPPPEPTRPVDPQGTAAPEADEQTEPPRLDEDELPPIPIF